MSHRKERKGKKKIKWEGKEMGREDKEWGRRRVKAVRSINRCRGVRNGKTR